MGIAIKNDKREAYGSRAFLRGESLVELEAEHSTKRGIIADRVTDVLCRRESINFSSIEATITQINLSNDLFHRYFDSVADLDSEIRRRSWKALLKKLRLVAIEASGVEALLKIARAYHAYAEEKRSLFKYVICSARHSHDGAKYFGQLGYLMRMVLLSCNVDINKCEKMANNLIDVIHGIALLKIEDIENQLSWQSTDELLTRYISKMFEESAVATA